MRNERDIFAGNRKNSTVKVYWMLKVGDSKERWLAEKGW